MEDESQTQDSMLRADYSAFGATKDFQYPQVALGDQPAPKETTAYIASLRNSLLEMQNDINAYLTEKMEEDKAAAATNGIGIANKVDEQKEEENYGEEVEDE